MVNEITKCDITSFFMMIIVILIQAYFVQILFNRIWYKTWCCGNKSKFKELNYEESLMLLILFRIILKLF